MRDMNSLPPPMSEAKQVDIIILRLGTVYEKMKKKLGNCDICALRQIATKIAALNMITLPELAKKYKKALIAWFAENVPNFPENVELSDEARGQSEQTLAGLAALVVQVAQERAALAVQVERERVALAVQIAHARTVQWLLAEPERIAQERAARIMHVIHVPGARGFDVYLPAPVGAAPPTSLPPQPQPVLDGGDILNPDGGNLDENLDENWDENWDEGFSLYL
jgi:hypothetical protein